MAGDPDIALALCVASMARRSLTRVEISGVALSASSCALEDVPDLAEARAALCAALPEGEDQLLAWAFDMSRERLLGVLAVLVAGSIDLAHEDASPADRLKQAVADRLAQQLEIDMNAFWQADLAFWVRLPKAALMSALAEAPGIAGKGERAREDILKAHAKLRKDDLAAKVAAAYEGVAYLPDSLVTPLASGCLTVTREGAAAAAAVQPVAAE